jgi:hypothetical protein
MELNMKQVKTRNVTCKSIIRNKEFVRGFKEIKEGKPFDYDFCPYDPNDLWAYERGRLFGLVFDGPIKSGNRVLQSAQFAFSQAYWNGSVI